MPVVPPPTEKKPVAVDLSRRRLLTGGAFLFFVFPFLMRRLFQLNVSRGAHFQDLAERNILSGTMIQPRRGSLLDYAGRPLALDLSRHTLVLYPNLCDKPEQTLQRMGVLVALSAAKQQEVLKELKDRLKHHNQDPIVLMDSPTFDDLSRVQVNRPTLPGVDVATTEHRRYIQADVGGHITGYTGLPPKDDTSDALRDWNPNFPIGKSGIEKLADDSLRGVAGRAKLSKDAHGQTIKRTVELQPKAGTDIHLSLDAVLQQAVWGLMGERTGSIVVMDVQTGGVRACVSKPGLDPNLFVDGISSKQWKHLAQDPERPLLNRAFQGLYAPGSTFKTVTALAALQEGEITPVDTVFCKHDYPLGNRVFHCWYPKGHKRVNVRQAIQRSCDVFFYQMAERLGMQKIATYAHMLGLGEPLGTGLEEATGQVPTPAWRKETSKEPWTTGDDLITGIGQGFLLVTPLHLAQLAARVATGFSVKPVLLKVNEVSSLGLPPLMIDDEYLALLRDGMHDAMNTSWGTGIHSRPKDFDMAGKTGTVQVVSERLGDFEDWSHIEKAKRPHSMFIGFAPFKNPRYAVSVVIEHGGGGSQTAAPLGVATLREALKLAPTVLPAAPASQEASATGAASGSAPSSSAASSAAADSSGTTAASSSQASVSPLADVPFAEASE